MNEKAAYESVKARETFYRLLKYRFRSEKEVRDKLKSKKFTPAVIDQTIDHFKQIDLIDDKKFTQSWIAARLNKPLGINRIRYELKLKGIAENLIREGIDNAVSGIDEDRIVSDLAKRRIAKYRNIDTKKAKQRVYGYLSRRGFSMSAIRKALYTL